MNIDPPSHADLLDAIQTLRDDIEPLVKMQPDLTDMVEVIQALKVGGKGVKWIASIATALLAIGGLMLAVRGLWDSFWGAPV